MFGTGSNFDIGVDVNLTDIASLRFDYLYIRFHEADADVVAAVPLPVDSEGPVADSVSLDATHQTHAFLFGLELTSAPRSARVYGIIGGGFYHRRVRLRSEAADVVPYEMFLSSRNVS